MIEIDEGLPKEDSGPKGFICTQLSKDALRAYTASLCEAAAVHALTKTIQELNGTKNQTSTEL